MKQILKGIYSDVSLSSLLGFKGGTAASLFYGLDRFSVDLDFDLLAEKSTELNGEQSYEKLWESVLKKVERVASSLGTVNEARVKRYTIFLLLSYGDTDHNVKVEISKRKPDFLTRDYFEFKDHLGIPMLVAKPNYVFASKLGALTTRKEFAHRDMFDVHYFCKNRWEIDESIIKALTGKTARDYLPECIRMVESVNTREILAGLGELLNDEKQKAWVKNHLKEETLFLLKSYLSVL